MSDFLSWLNDEIVERGWSNNEMARRSGMSSANMSKVLTGRYAVTWEFCAGVAKALHLPPEQVFREAGLLPRVAAPGAVQSLADVARHLSADHQALLRDYAQFLYERQKQ
jgi:transcriptional regulator with XRE-family HTH domain